MELGEARISRRVRTRRPPARSAAATRRPSTSCGSVMRCDDRAGASPSASSVTATSARDRSSGSTTTPTTAMGVLRLARPTASPKRSPTARSRRGDSAASSGDAGMRPSITRSSFAPAPLVSNAHRVTAQPASPVTRRSGLETTRSTRHPAGNAASTPLMADGCGATRMSASPSCRATCSIGESSMPFTTMLPATNAATGIAISVTTRAERALLRITDLSSTRANARSRRRAITRRVPSCAPASASAPTRSAARPSRRSPLRRAGRRPGRPIRHASHRESPAPRCGPGRSAPAAAA